MPADTSIPGESWHSDTKLLVRKLANGARLVAVKKPGDEEAQRRAQVAVHLYHDLFSPCPTPRLLEVRPAEMVRQPTRRRAAYSLPTEIYIEIIRHVAECHERGNTTLQSLACTCILFQEIAEEHMYRLPSSKRCFGLGPEVFIFYFSIMIDPRRAKRVQSLSVMWDYKYDDHQQLVDIVRACPNLRTLTLRWKSGFASRALNTKRLKKHTKDMNALLASCPAVTTFKFFESLWARRPLTFPGLQPAQFFEQLTELEMDTAFECPVLLSYDFSNLRSLTVRQRVYDMNYKIPPQIYGNFPRLQNLDLSTMTINFTSLKNACIAWGPTLRHLRFCVDNGQTANAVGELLYFLPALEGLWVLSRSSTTRKVIEDITKNSCLNSLRLRTICLKSFISETMRGFSLAKLEPIDQALEDMINILHPTLETLYLEYHRPLKSRFLGHLKKAKNLRRFRFNLQKYVEEGDLIDLVEGRPKLEIIRPCKRDNRATDYPCIISGEVIPMTYWGRGWGEYEAH
jgi:hypothetical protein